MNPTDAVTNVLVYSHYFWPSTGGVETYARLLAEGIAGDQAFPTIVVTQTPRPGPECDAKFRVFRAPGFLRLWKLIRAADVVVLAGPALAPMIAATLARKPLVIEHHSYQAICPNGLLLNKVRGGTCAEAFRNKRYGECCRCVRADRGSVRALTQVATTFLRRRLCRNAFANVAITEHVRLRHDLEKMKVIHYGIPDLPSPAGTELGKLAGGKTHFGYVGRLVEEKGLSLLLEAARKLKSQGVPYRLTFVGDGPLRNSLEAQGASAGLNGNIRFAGFLDGQALQQATADMDVVVMPSTWEETAGLAAMEQMMRGRTVLAADIGGLGEVVGDAGLKFRPFDADDLAEKMVRLVGSQQLRAEISARARERALRLFSLPRMIEEYLTVIRAALHNE